MGAGLFGTQSPWIPGGARVAGLIGIGPLAGARGRAVCERLDLFVAPALEDASDLPDPEWVRIHNTKVRESVKGSVNLTKRLNGELDEETEKPQAPERPIKGEAFMAKMIQQKLRRKPRE